MNNFERKETKGTFPMKVVIRRLPPNFTSKLFRALVSPIPDYNYFHFVKAVKEDSMANFATAYINFTFIDDVLAFKEKYDGYVFLASTGEEYPATVEYAPSQRIPQSRKFYNKDFKCGTIETNDYYKQFLEKRNRKELVKRAEYDYEILTSGMRRENISVTPLVKFISERKNCISKRKMEGGKKNKKIYFVNAPKTFFRKTSYKKV